MKNITEIDILISNYLAGEAMPNEALQLQDWRNLSPENEAYFQESQKASNLLTNEKEISIDKNAAWNKIQGSKSKNTFNLSRWTAIAASFAVIAVSIFLLKSPAEPTSFIATNTSITANLKDGSEVVLNQNTQLEISKEFNQGQRAVSLIGKAKFTVEHNDENPFVIDAGGLKVEDLGTVFTVDAYPENDTVFVVVEEGIVRLYDQYGSELVIKAGEKAWYIKSQKLIVTDLDAKVVKFDFKDTKLVDIVSILDDSFNDLVKLQPESIGRCKVTTQFFDENIETIISVLAETLDFDYEYKNGVYTLNGKPCN